jgi:hypothetical protein
MLNPVEQILESLQAAHHHRLPDHPIDAREVCIAPVRTVLRDLVEDEDIGV